MRQIRALYYFEIKKILGRKSTWIAFGILIAFYFFQITMPMFTQFSYSAKSGENYSMTLMEKEERTRRDGLALTGRKLDDSLFKEVRAHQENLQKKKNTMGLREYDEQQQRYQMVDSVITAMIGEGNSLDFTGGTSVERQLMEGRKQYISQMQIHYHLSEEEQKYWQKKEKEIEKPFILQYSGGFENLVGMPGCYMGLLMTGFLVAVVISRVFAEEHARRVDQLALSSPLGKKHLYFAKILAGVSFTFFATLLLTGIIFVTLILLYGADGASAPVQLIAGWYSYPLTLGQILIVMLILEFLGAILTSIFTMVLSEGFRSSTMAMAIVIACYAAARLVTIPADFRVLSQIWNYLPINTMLLSKFLDVRLVSLFGVKLTCWQFAPIVYGLLSLILVMLGKRIYCNYQVEY